MCNSLWLLCFLLSQSGASFFASHYSIYGFWIKSFSELRLKSNLLTVRFISGVSVIMTPLLFLIWLRFNSFSFCLFSGLLRVRGRNGPQAAAGLGCSVTSTLTDLTWCRETSCTSLAQKNRIINQWWKTLCKALWGFKTRKVSTISSKDDVKMTIDHFAVIGWLLKFIMH